MSDHLVQRGMSLETPDNLRLVPAEDCKRRIGELRFLPQVFQRTKDIGRLCGLYDQDLLAHLPGSGLCVGRGGIDIVEIIVMVCWKRVPKPENGMSADGLPGEPELISVTADNSGVINLQPERQNLPWPIFLLSCKWS